MHLLDGHRRGQALDKIHVRLLHLAEELPGVGGQALHVAALALGKERIERQRRLAAAADAGQDHELVPWDVHVDVLEIVLARTSHADHVFRHGCTQAAWGRGDQAQENPGWPVSRMVHEGG